MTETEVQKRNKQWQTLRRGRIYAETIRVINRLNSEARKSPKVKLALRRRREKIETERLVSRQLTRIKLKRDNENISQALDKQRQRLKSRLEWIQTIKERVKQARENGGISLGLIVMKRADQS